MNIEHAGGDASGAGVAVAPRERCDRASARLIERPCARQTRRGQAGAVHRVAAGAGQRASAGDRAAGERHRAHRVGKAADVEHAAVDRHAAGAQSIADAVGERASANGRQAGKRVGSREREQAGAILGERAGTGGDRAADSGVASTPNNEIGAGAGDRAAADREEIGVGINPTVGAEGNVRSSPDVVSADVPQGSVIRFARTAQRQSLACHRDATLQLQSC